MNSVSQSFIPLMVPNLTEDDIQAAVSVLRSGQLVQGEAVSKMESLVAELVGTKYALAVSNGTASLHLALLVLGVGQGDEVIVPAFSYIATANVVEIVGAKPVFVDIDPVTFNIDVNKIETAISSRTKAIMPVHEFGLAADMDQIMSIARKYGLAVIEDAACALGAKYNSVPVGSIGDLGSFSFHPRKAITSGEGGILTFNDEKFVEPIMALRNHGIVMNNGQMDFKYAGYNYRITNFQAALIISQLSRLKDQLKYKQELADLYFEYISNPRIKVPAVGSNRVHTWQSFHVMLDDSLNQKEVIAGLLQRNIGTNYGAQCIPAQTYYKERYKLDVQKSFPNALRAFSQGLVLPLYDKLEKSQVILISQILNELKAE